MTVGDKVAANELFTVEPAGKTIAYTISDEKVAKIDENGNLVALAAGEATITFSSKYANEAATVKVTVKKAVLESVAQTSKTAIAAVVKGNTADIKAADFVITNTYTKATVAVKSVSVDKNDATKVTIETFVDMADGKDYTVKFDGVEKTFTATNGTVATIGLEKTTIDTAKETEMKAVLKDANGVELEKVSFPGNGKLTFTINVTNGYTTANSLYLNKAGDTATVDLVYHSGKYDENGIEVGNIENKGIVVTAVDAAAVTDNNFTVKIGAAGKSYASVTETKLAVGDKAAAAYFEIVKSNGDKVNTSADYTIESSNLNVLILGGNTIDAAGVALTPVNAGTAYIIVKKDATVIATLPVTVVAERKATSLALSTYAVTLSNSAILGDSAEVKVTLKDQYGEDMSIDDAAVSVTTLTVPAKDVAGFEPAVSGAKFTLNGAGMTKGAYQLKVTVGSLAKTLSVTVQDPDENATSSYSLVLSANTVDTVIKADTTTNASITATVYELKNGVKFDVVSGASFVLSKDGKVVDSDTSAGAMTYEVNDITTGDKLENGTYSLKVTFTGDNGKDVTFTRTFTVTDSQPKAVATVSSNSVAANADLNSIIKVTYEGKECAGAIVGWTGTKAGTVGTATIATTDYVKTVKVSITVGSNTVVQDVAVAQTIQVK